MVMSMKKHWLATTATLACLSIASTGLIGQVAAADKDAQSADKAEQQQPGPLAGKKIEAGDAGQAMVWGDKGRYGVVMAHGAAYDADSWADQAGQIAGRDMMALALEDTSPAKLAAAAEYLKQEYDLDGVALLGASAGGQSAIQAAADNPGTFDQLILLSPAGGDVARLDDAPKLFIYSEDEQMADNVRQMAKEAPGETQTMTVPGDAHAQAIFKGQNSGQAMSAIMERLQYFDASGKDE